MGSLITEHFYLPFSHLQFASQLFFFVLKKKTANAFFAQ